MNQDRVVGAAKNFGGKVEEGFGRVAGDGKRQAEGLADQAMGAAQNLYGQAKDTASDAADVVKKGASNAEDFVRRVIESQPYTAVAVALAVGLALGWRRRSHD
jgi:MYXO-CTERM domain-containing protein